MFESQLSYNFTMLTRPTIGENWQLVTSEPVESKKNRLKFKTAGKLPINLEEFIVYTPILIKENRRM